MGFLELFEEYHGVRVLEQRIPSTINPRPYTLNLESPTLNP